ncbi:Creatinase/aminopeptidase [Multifurca ochricompacta]|uniref:Creatinase/aminopeptidase n=1 Tax=Multifurca ochricompacta TaxID=376703 RepID=A0AAD4LUI0_9AGAM|nr:Creatinase/aminopeptidase [Multifurca ochricompacta]
MVSPAQAHAQKTLQKLAELLPAEERIKPQIIVLAGSVTPYRNDTDRELPFRQESNFFYITGCSVPSSLVILRASSTASDSEISLFIPDAEPGDLMWSMCDIANIFHTKSFASSFASTLAAAPGALIHTLPQTAQFPALPPFPAGVTNCSDEYLLLALHRARLIKSDAEIKRIRHANEISSRAHEVVMRVLGAGVRSARAGQCSGVVHRHLPLPGEWLIESEAEAEAIFVASCRREGAVNQAYLPVVAASTRAATLNYCRNDCKFARGQNTVHDHGYYEAFASGTQEVPPQVLLIDAGCEWDNYASDITRTMPVGNGGKFTPEARAIYELVLKMQTASLAVLKPGLHWDAVQLLCHRTLIRGFQKLGIFKAGTEEAVLLASGLSAVFFPFGVGHSLGLDVLDVPSASKPVLNPTITRGGAEPDNEKFYENLRLRLPLEAGMVVTVEPGIYFHHHLLSDVRNSEFIDCEVLSRYESVGGVRIEDVVLITPDGAENFSTVRRDLEWIEGVCSGEL